MPTNQKTPKLGLNNWVGTDKPMRSDFVEDNAILDRLLGSHLENMQLHLSAEDREKMQNPFVTGELGGTGSASYTHGLPLPPRFILVFLKNKPLTETDTSAGCVVVNAAAACPGFGTQGISLSGNSLTLCQSAAPQSGVKLNLNANGGQYFYVAFS